MAHYDAQQAQVSTTTSFVVAKTAANGAPVWQINQTTTEQQSETTWSDSVEVVCDASGIGIGMQGHGGRLRYSEGIHVTYSGGMLRFPSNLAVGMRLPEAKLVMRTMMLNKEISSSTTRIYRRIVTGEDTKTTPAGTFDCWVIDATVEHDMGNRTSISQEKIWLSKGSGIVAVELRTKGKLVSHSELTRITP